MSFELWVAFTLASMALLAIPGPTVMLVVSYALVRGRASAWATVPGVVLGDFTAMTLSLLGAGAVLQTSSVLFTMLKIAGALYLIWLGVKLWRAKPELNEITATPKNSNAAMFWNTWLVTSLNPKGIMFFIAFVPQFIDPALPVLPQFVIMETTFLALAAANIIAWALLAGKMRAKFKHKNILRTINRIGGSFLIGAGVLAGISQRSA